MAEMMTVSVVGATGNTGRPLVEQLLALGHRVRVVVRARDRLPKEVLEHPDIKVLEAGILDLADGQLADFVGGCDAVVSCLGHVPSFKGIFGEPRQLCTDAVQRLCRAIQSNRPASPTKFILMSSVAIPNPDLEESRPPFERAIVTLLRWLVPPHRDNETAAEYLHTTLGRNDEYVEWCSVRPDKLIEGDVSEYQIVESPLTGIFSGRPTTRANVARFMTTLIENQETWGTWKYRMPVVMNSVESPPH